MEKKNRKLTLKEKIEVGIKGVVIGTLAGSMIPILFLGLQKHQNMFMKKIEQDIHIK